MHFIKDSEYTLFKDNRILLFVHMIVSEKEVLKSSVFSAYGIHLYENQHVYISPRERIIYHHISTNPGGHYNTSTGEYTCPVSGVYFFQFSIYGYFIRDSTAAVASAVLVKNGRILVELAMFNFGTEGIHNTMSNAMVLQCNAGEKVWVEGDHENNHLFNLNNLNWFSGFLISLL